MTSTWTMPRDAHEFQERYGNRITAWAKKFGKDQWQEVFQNSWLELLKPTSGRIGDPCKDRFAYLNRYMAHMNENQFLAYIRAAVKTHGVMARYPQRFSGTPDALNHVTSLDFITDEEGQNIHDYVVEQWVHDHRFTQRDPIRNDADRIIYLREFLAYVERHDSKLLPLIMAIEPTHIGERGNNKPIRKWRRVGQTLGYPQEKTDSYARRITRLAERFQGLKESGEIHFFITKDTTSRFTTRKARKRVPVRPAPPREELVRMLTDMTYMQAGKHYGVDAMKVRQWALEYGFVRNWQCVIEELSPEEAERRLAKRKKNGY